MIDIAQHVYRGRSGHITESVTHVMCKKPDPRGTCVATIADVVPAARIMSHDVVCARADLATDALIELMVRNHVGCVPVVDERGRPIGMITKLDLVEKMLAGSGMPFPSTAGDLMFPLAFTLDARATVAHVATLMSLEDIHHVPIIGPDGYLIGVISTLDVVRWLASNDGLITEHHSDGCT